ncbi:hypothetical protein [Nocardioides sp.]|uniref:hypothetical protein n=1 Tax=Nocardioides sp. TaxID=35761 RepID=UPI0026072175|nr:hypothetical protein [Nocardioides sp.]MCW2735537.1 hypothetical protein [Nocardioides sp.]
MNGIKPLLGIGISVGVLAAAVFFGTAFDLSGVLVAIVAGALLGIVSERLGAQIQSAVDGRAPAPARDATPAT